MPPLSESPVGLAAAPDDVLRSIRRWLGLLLPEPWDIQYVNDEDAERPSGFVIPATRTTNPGGSAYVRDFARDFDAFLYPPGVEGDPMASRVEAERLAHLVERAFNQGVTVEGARISRTMRLPVWDHADVPWDQDIPEGREPFDMLPIRGFSVEARVDPDDDSLYTVVATFQATWRDDGDVSRFDGPVLQDVRVEAKPT